MYVHKRHTHIHQAKGKRGEKNPNHSKNNGMSYSFVFFVVMVFRFHYDGMDITAVVATATDCYATVNNIIRISRLCSFSLAFSFSFVLSCAELKTVCCWFKLAIVMLLSLTTARQPETIINSYGCECFLQKFIQKKKRTYIPKRAGSNWNQKELNAAHGLCIGMYIYISIVTCVFLCDFRCVSMCSFASVDIVKSKWSCCRIETLLKNLQSYIICIIKLASVQYTCYSIQFL